MIQDGQQQVIKMVKTQINEETNIYLDGYLKYQLDTLVYNAKSDWDFVILVTGDRMVRVGKSVLAMNMGSYIAHRLKTKFDLDNIHFSSQDMIDYAQEAETNSVIIYDEGREGLAATKHAKQIQQDLLDYFAECGQLNHIFIIVMPDYFELKETIAVGRSEYLINVWRAEEKKEIDLYKEGEKIPVVKFKRGYFEFFNRKKKAKLYDISKSTRRKNYQLVQPNFKGRFTNYYPIDEEGYRKKKKEALMRFKERKKKDTLKKTKYDVFRNEKIKELRLKKMTHKQISELFVEKYGYQVSSRQIGRLCVQMEI